MNSSGTTLYSESLGYYPNLYLQTANDSVNGNWTYTNDTLTCIIRERHATEGFGRQRIAEEEDGSVKLMRGTWLQALQAHTIEVATILGRGFALCSFGSGENGNSSGERS